MSGRVVLRPKGHTEDIFVYFDFSDELDPTEDILEQLVECSVYSGVDPLPGNLIDGAASHTGGEVRQSIHGGLPGVTYLLICSIGTTALQVLMKVAFLVVEES